MKKQRDKNNKGTSEEDEVCRLALADVKTYKLQ